MLSYILNNFKVKRVFLNLLRIDRSKRGNYVYEADRNIYLLKDVKGPSKNGK